MKKLIAALAACCLLFTSLCAVAATPRPIPVLSEEDVPETPPGIHNYLLLCVDSWNASPNNLGNTDGMVLVTADEAMGKISLTSFVRDLLVKNPEKDFNRLSRYVINNGGNKEAVEKLVGIYETHFGIRINHYIVVDWTMIQNIIDACGGVDITITDGEAIRLRSKTAYTASWTDPVLPSKNAAGTYHFKGHAAVIYMRIRSSYVVNGEANDFRRTSRARQVLSSLASSLKDISYDRALELLDAVVENTLVTDMSAADLFEALQLAFDLKGSEMADMRIPIQGTYEEVDYGGSALQIDYPANRKALHNFLYGTFIVREEEIEAEDSAPLSGTQEGDSARADGLQLYDVPTDGSAYAAFLTAFNAWITRPVDGETEAAEDAATPEFAALMEAYQAWLAEYRTFQADLSSSKVQLLMMSRQKEMEERQEQVAQALDRLDQTDLSEADEALYLQVLEASLEEGA